MKNQSKETPTGTNKRSCPEERRTKSGSTGFDWAEFRNVRRILMSDFVNCLTLNASRECFLSSQSPLRHSKDLHGNTRGEASINLFIHTSIHVSIQVPSTEGIHPLMIHLSVIAAGSIKLQTSGDRPPAQHKHPRTLIANIKTSIIKFDQKNKEQNLIDDEQRRVSLSLAFEPWAWRQLRSG